MRTLLILLAIAAAAEAQTLNWVNSGGGTFSTPGNWSPLGPPGPAHDASFNIINTYSISFTANATNNTFSVGSGTVTFLLNGYTYTTTASNNNSVTGSAIATTFFGGTLNLGSFNIGTGLGNSFVHFGSGITATIGSNFNIGGNGTGRFLVNSGADVTTNTALLGTGFTGTGLGIATVDGVDSTWAVSGNCRIGEYSTGQLTVSNGAAFTCNSLEIGAFPGAVGSVTIGGNNATFTANGTVNLGGFLAVNPGASATLTVNAGSIVNFNGATNLRAVATIAMNGGTLNLEGLAFQPGASVNWSTGKIHFADAASLTPAVLDLLLGGGGTLGVNRTLSAASGTATLSSPLILGGTLLLPDANLNASLTVQSLGKLSATGLVTLAAGQTLRIENLATLHSDTAIFNSGGTITLLGSAAAVTGFMANNFGLVEGSGRFLGGLNNGTGGTVRLLSAHHIIIDTIGPTNSGAIDLAGGVIEYTKVLSNLANGFISGRGEFRGGTSAPGSNGLSNLGVVALSAGFTDFRGDVINAGAGRIVTAGGGVTTFYDDVTHNGAEIRTSMGARSVFFGAQSGAGPFTGTGIVEYSGDLRPGNSPALVTHEGTVILNSSATFAVELQGLTPGSGYDQLRVSGAIYLAGALEVDLLNGFTPVVGNTFRIVDNVSPFAVDGAFSNLPQNAVFSTDGLLFKIDYAGGSGNDVVLTVVPVPEPLGLVGVGLLIVVRVGCKRLWTATPR